MTRDRGSYYEPSSSRSYTDIRAIHRTVWWRVNASGPVIPNGERGKNIGPTDSSGQDGYGSPAFSIIVLAASCKCARRVEILSAISRATVASCKYADIEVVSTKYSSRTRPFSRFSSSVEPLVYRVRGRGS